MNKPNAFDFMTDAGMHAAMKAWAAAKAKPTLSVAITYSDSSDVWAMTFERATKEVSYRLQDGEVYTVDVDTAKFIDCFEEYTQKELKANVLDYAQPTIEGVKLVSVVWKLNK